MSFASPIPSSTQFAQSVPRGLLVLHTAEGANGLVQRFLSPRKFLGGVTDTALERSTALDPGQQLLHRFDNRALGSLGADRHPLRTATGRRAPVEGVPSLARSDHHPGAAGTAVKHP